MMSLNRTEIQAIRRLLFLSVVEAGRNVAIDETHPNGVAANTWQKWEKGEKPIPERIGEQLKSLLLRREAEILRIEYNARNGSPFFALWYENRADCLPFFKRENNELSVVDWKLSQSIASEIAAKGSCVVPFNAEKFKAWQKQTNFSEHESWAIAEYFQAS